MITKNNMPQSYHGDLITMIDSIDCGFVKFINDSTTTILYANDYFFQLLGYTRDEYLEKFIYHFSASIHPEDSQKFKNTLARQRAMGTSLSFEYRALRKDGSLLWIRLQGELYFSENYSYYCCYCLDITDNKLSYEHLAKAKLELDLIANNLPGGVIKLSFPQYKLLYSNDGFYKLSGYSRMEYEKKFNNICLGLLHPDDTIYVQNIVKEAVKNNTALSAEYRILNKSGQIRWSYLNGSQIEIQNGFPVYLCVIVDITKQKEYEAQLTIAQKTHQLLCEFSKETNWEYDIMTGSMTRYGKIDTTYSQERIIFDFLNTIIAEKIIHPQDVKKYKKIIESMKNGRTYFKLVLRMKNYVGIYNWYCIQGSVVFDKYGVGYKVIGKTANIDNEKQRELSASENQFALYSVLGTGFVPNTLPTPDLLSEKPISVFYEDYDSVTGLINFCHFMDSASSLIQKKSEKNLAVISFDLNRFKNYNMTYGFTFGNQILKMIADALIPYIKPGELISRIHSDHFIALLTYKTLNELTGRISSYYNDITALNSQSDPSTYISISCGVYLLTEGDNNIAEAIDKANQARRSIKNVPGPHNYAIYSQALEYKEKEKNILAEGFSDAFENEEFLLYFQPVYHAKSKKVIQAEAMIRWKRPGNRLLDLKDFSFLIQDCANSNKLDYYLIEEVCKQVKYWKNKNYKTVPITIKLCGFHHDPIDFCNILEELCSLYDIVPKELIFEFDETQFLEETDSLSYLTKILQNKGYLVTLNCFQQFFTCLQFITDFHLNAVKLDISYFKNTVFSDGEKNVLKKLIELTQELGITMIATGVEGIHLLEMFQQFGCHIFQGGSYQPPLPVKDFTKFILKD